MLVLGKVKALRDWCVFIETGHRKALVVGQATLPDVELFVSELTTRARTGFSVSVRSIATAIVHAGGSPDDFSRLENGPCSRPAYMLACCAEEIASVHGLVERYRERVFAHSCLERLRPFLAPLDPDRASLDFHRLYADFKVHPARTRTRLVEYLIEVNAISGLKRRIEADPVCQLAIEMTASSDGVGGILSAMVMRHPPFAGLVEPDEPTVPLR